MKYYICGISEKGNYRKKNEDCFLIDRTVYKDCLFEKVLPSPFISGVSDGVACEMHGELASHIALETIGKINFSSETKISDELINVHNKIIAYGEINPYQKNMQTTLCCITIDEKDSANCINIGDSRMYRFCDGTLRQISTDQSLVEHLFRTGKITKEEKKAHKNKNLIFPVLGNTKHQPNIEITPLKLKVSGNDIILICTDGFSDYVSEDELEIGLSLDISLKERVKTLAELAINRGSTDNITIVALKSVYERK